MTPTTSPARRRRHFESVEFVWRGITIRAVYEPDYLCRGPTNFARAMSHLTITVKNPKRAPLPITETGYRSHFQGRGEVEAAGGIAAYVTAWLEEEAKSPQWKAGEAKRNQWDLFG